MYSHSQKFSGEHCRRIQTEELREFIILELACLNSDQIALESEGICLKYVTLKTAFMFYLRGLFSF